MVPNGQCRVGGGVSKVVRLGELPLKLEVDGYYNAIRPNSNQDPWQLQATITFVFQSQPSAAFAKKAP